MRKKIYQIAFLLIASSTSFAQWAGSNTTTGAIYRDGSVGIGTASPQANLHVLGAIKAEANTDNGNIGASLHISHPGKTANGTANNWVIYNMSGIYGNSLQFWAYDNIGCTTGGLCSNRFTIMDNGNVGIGTMNPGSFRLAVEGTIGAREVRVTNANPWPDYVFSRNYHLKNLYALESYIKKNNHLPNIPSAQEVKDNGIEVGQMSAKLLEKIEELTLYVIELKKDMDKIKAENVELQSALKNRSSK
jgi:hypothetical protein